MGLNLKSYLLVPGLVLLVPGIAGSILKALDDNYDNKHEHAWVRILRADYRGRKSYNTNLADKLLKYIRNGCVD